MNFINDYTNIHSHFQIFYFDVSSYSFLINKCALNVRLNLMHSLTFLFTGVSLLRLLVVVLLFLQHLPVRMAAYARYLLYPYMLQVCPVLGKKAHILAIGETLISSYHMQRD